MLPEIQSLHKVWSSNRTSQITPSRQITFDDLTNSIISTGPFSYFIIDFFDMSLSHISPSLYEMHGLDPETTTFNTILDMIHPDDIGFVVKAEAFLTRFFYEKIGREKLLTYKISYSHRVKVKSGEYVLFNHQALMLTMDDSGGYGKSLNIHTRIDHLSSSCTYRISLIGLNGEPSFMNLSLDDEDRHAKEYSKREIDIIRLMADGLNNGEIAKKLGIAVDTVKTHRKNILAKSGAKNTAQLIRDCILQGII